MTIKNHTLFANGELFTHKLKDGEFIRFYGIKSLVIKNNTTKLESEFIRETDIKLMKSLSNIGISAKLNKSRYNKISRRVNKFYKDTFSTKADWKHIVSDTGGVLKIWLTNVSYDRQTKRIEGDIHLLKETVKGSQRELTQYSETIYESRAKGGAYGRYHDFSKRNDYESFTHHMELEKNEMRGGIRKLKLDATLEENTAKTNEVIEVVNVSVEKTNQVIDTMMGMQAEIEALKAELAKRNG
ncbi:hypothetical protein BCU85_17320 [Vibrio lentus]|uniref:hypothetical protein n=1 Tax=Vibrio lentus TaxID=136468 RepID=UPI000C81A790|nr:hypothetical protein [Vibrio lentus]MCC4818020.1 hypothetical protein [Vibrio lentus]PMG72957.1 hypothetical protein BCU85_17320 [Vibrio lentus]PMK89929.1 hypothetical protein BCT88_21405 [Vibrio lentus]PML25469.1 hypothetical protein BCT80_19465 [Vibrio lentus]PMM27957.1 hypothetical protein BCT57_15850 [Vibrio lentus]